MIARRISSSAVLSLAVAALALLTLAGGRGTQFGDPLPGLTPDQLARFHAGKAAFEREFDAAAGLGPVFNNTACAECHFQGAIGGGSDTLETRYGQVINGVFNSLPQSDGQLLHAQ
jgi:hypothetical protein